MLMGFEKECPVDLKVHNMHLNSSPSLFRRTSSNRVIPDPKSGREIGRPAYTLQSSRHMFMRHLSYSAIVKWAWLCSSK